MRLALFDANGTIFDDIPIWYQSVQTTFRHFGKEAPSIEQYFRELEGDYLKIYTSRGVVASRDELNAIYEPAYASLIDSVEPSVGVKQTLGQLADAGLALGIISSQLESLLTPLFQRFDLTRLFRYQECHVFDKQQRIRDIVAKEGITSEECCFVGDSPSDIRHGRKAEVVTIAFRNGYIPDDLIAAANPHHIVDAFLDLKDLIAPDKRVS